MKSLHVLITGSTDGIGLKMAEILLNKGAKVIIHGRNRKRVLKTIERLPGSKEGVWSDFASLSQVTDLAKQVSNKTDKLDILINNAGVYKNSYQKSEDGFELTYAVNHLAPFLLTYELLPLLLNSEKGIIANVSSMAHSGGDQMKKEDINMPEAFNPFISYAFSKLCNIAFTKVLAEKIKNTKVTTYSVHPGVIDTKLLREGWGFGGASLQSGAENVLDPVFSGKARSNSGSYFHSKEVAQPSQFALDKDFQNWLWQNSELACKINYKNQY